MIEKLGDFIFGTWREIVGIVVSMSGIGFGQAFKHTSQTCSHMGPTCTCGLSF